MWLYSPVCSDLFGNPENRFSHGAAQILLGMVYDLLFKVAFQLITKLASQQNDGQTKSVFKIASFIR